MLAWTLVALTAKPHEFLQLGPVEASNVVGIVATAVVVLGFVVLAMLLLTANLTQDLDLAALSTAMTAAVLSSSVLTAAVYTVSIDASIETATAQAVAFGFASAVVLVHLALQGYRRWLLVLVGLLALSPLFGVSLLFVQVLLFTTAGAWLGFRGIHERRPAVTASGILLLAIGSAELLTQEAELLSQRSTAALVVILCGILASLGAGSIELRRAYLSQCLLVREVQLSAEFERSRTAEVTHEQRAALCAVEGALTTLRFEGESMSSSDFSALAEAASSEILRLRRLVTGDSQPALERIAVIDAIGPFVQCQTQLGSHITIKGDRTLEVVAVPDALARVTQNLVENAIRHGEATQIGIELRRRSGHIEINVSDNGHGINEALREVIFERGVSSNPTANSGLGLFLSRQLIESFSGSIFVQDTTGRGATVSIHLPDPETIDLTVDVRPKSGTEPATDSVANRAAASSAALGNVVSL